VLANASIGWRIFDVAARQSICAWVLRRPLHMKKGEEMSRLKKLRTFVLGGLIVMTQLASAIKSKYATENLFRVNQSLRPAVTTV
jgi:hypothetical protein